MSNRFINNQDIRNYLHNELFKSKSNVNNNNKSSKPSSSKNNSNNYPINNSTNNEQSLFTFHIEFIK